VDTIINGGPDMDRIREAAKRIAERYAPARIMLFGSCAAGTAGPDSDADILVVMDMKGSRREQTLDILRLVADVGMPKDIFVATPQEFDRYRDIPGTITSIAFRTGTTLYDRQA